MTSRIGRRIKRRRARPGIADRRDQHDAARIRLGQHVAHHGVGRPGKTHIDDAGVLARRPVEPLENIEGGALRAVAVAGKSAHREQLHLRRNADQFAVRGDGAGHGGAVRMRRRRRAERVVFVHDHAGEIGMAGVDLGIDHRHQHVVAAADAVRFHEMQLGNDILRGGGIGRRRRLRLSATDRENSAAPTRCPDSATARAVSRATERVAVDAPALQRAAGEREALRLQQRQFADWRAIRVEHCAGVTPARIRSSTSLGTKRISPARRNVDVAAARLPRAGRRRTCAAAASA